MTFIAAGAAIATEAAIALGATAGGLVAAGAGIAGGALAGGVVGAGLGAATSAITGGDVGKGALYGGIGGVVTGGAGAALGAGTAGAEAASGSAGNAVANGTGGIAGTGNAVASGIGGTAGVPNVATDVASGTGNVASGVGTGGAPAMADTGSSFSQGLNDTLSGLKTAAMKNPFTTAALVGQGINYLVSPKYQTPAPLNVNKQPISNIHLSPGFQRTQPVAMNPGITYDQGGIVGATELNQSGMFPQSQLGSNQYATPTQAPAQAQQLQRAVNSDYDTQTNTYTGEPVGFAEGGSTSLPVNKFYAAGLQQAQQQQQLAPQQQPVLQPQPTSVAPSPPQPLGVAGYASGRMVSGKGDGVSDGIGALIDGQQPAALASNEFVIPARIVSELGNGSSEAGAKQLQAMIDRIQTRRKKTVGKGKVAVNSKAYKEMPV